MSTSDPRVDFRCTASEGGLVRCTVEVRDAGLYGKSAEFRIKRTVAVHDSRAVNSSDIPFSKKIESLQPSNEVIIPRSTLKLFTYRGDKIEIDFKFELEIDTGIIFDTKVDADEDVPIAYKPQINENAKEIVEPKDAFNFMANLRAIPLQNQAITLALLFVGFLIVGVNSIIGIHDEMAPEPLTWVYDHVGSKGSESPFFKSLMGSGVTGLAVWYAMRRQLRKYMKFELYSVPARICAKDSLPAASFVRGKARVPLQNVRIRVVACNMEKGQYKRGSGTKERTVSFTEPIRAVILYDKLIPYVPTGMPLENWLDGQIAFAPMFGALYPPQQVGSSHGITVYWEVQLISEIFVDQELVGPIECFPWEDFLNAS